MSIFSFSQRVKSKASEILIDESPAETSEEVEAEAGELQGGAWVPVHEAHTQDQQSPQQHRDQSRGETENKRS